MKRVLIVAGDPSGDLIASQLVLSLKKISPALEVTSVGGHELKKVSDRFLANIVDQGAFGLPMDPRQLCFFRSILKGKIIPEIEKNQPDAVIPVDFYGFNSLVAKAAKARGRKVFYYASPQFWASRAGRADRLRPSVDLFLCLFPFEIGFYQKRNLPAAFVGHPLIDSIPIPADRPARVETTIGLLPGSREKEIKRHLPVMVGACNRISRAAPGTRFIVFTVRHVPRQLYHDLISSAPEKSQSLIELVEDENYVWRSQIDLAISASGMETLENALLGIPMVVMYKMNWLFYMLAKQVIRIPHIGMPNLLSGKLLVPEFIQSAATADSISAPIINWIENPLERQLVSRELVALRNQFGNGGASERAARTILEKVT